MSNKSNSKTTRDYWSLRLKNHYDNSIFQEFYDNLLNPESLAIQRLLELKKKITNNNGGLAELIINGKQIESHLLQSLLLKSYKTEQKFIGAVKQAYKERLCKGAKITLTDLLDISTLLGVTPSELVGKYLEPKEKHNKLATPALHSPTEGVVVYFSEKEIKYLRMNGVQKISFVCINAPALGLAGHVIFDDYSNIQYTISSWNGKKESVIASSEKNIDKIIDNAKRKKNDDNEYAEKFISTHTIYKDMHFQFKQLLGYRVDEYRRSIWCKKYINKDSRFYKELEAIEEYVMNESLSDRTDVTRKPQREDKASLQTKIDYSQYKS